MRTLSIILLLILPIRFIHAIPVNEEEKRVYTTVRTDDPPRIDGDLSDQCWEFGTWDGDFVQQYPNSGGKASQETRVKVLHDYDNLYVAILCLDTEPEKIRRIFNRRDNFSGDCAGIAFDSYDDKRTAFEFNVTSAGQKIDLKHSGDADFDFNWNAIWDAATAITDSGWVAELRIPFSQLRYNSKNEMVWGMHVWRWIDRLKEESQWQLIPQGSSAMVYLFGRLEGISDIRSARQVELLPYASAKIDYKGDQENPHLKKTRGSLNGGIDAKIGISSNFTLDATINPDFGQVEADPSELNLTAYETRFEEKRPFFLEGKEIFDYRIDSDRLFYSRRIGSKPSYSPDTGDDEYLDITENTTILGSAKLTGRTSGGLSIGIMNSVTAREYATIYSDTREDKIVAEPLTNYLVGRIKKETNNSNTIFGLSFNSVIRQNNDQVLKDNFTNTAHTGGIDFQQYFKDRKYFLSAKMAGSYIEGSEQSIQNLQESHIHRFQRPDADHIEFDSLRRSLAGTGGRLSAGKQEGRFKYKMEFNYWTPQFNINDIGYMRVADVYEIETDISYESLEPKGALRKYEISLEQDTKFSFGNELTDAKFQLSGFSEFQNLWHSSVFFSHDLASLDTRVLRGGPALMRDPKSGAHIYFSTNSAKDLWFSAHSGFWGSSNNASYEYHYGGRISYNPVDQITLSLDVVLFKDYNIYQYVDKVDADEGDESIYLMGTINRSTLPVTLRAEYFITPELSLQYYGSPYFSVGDYKDFKRVNNSRSAEQPDRYHFYGSENTYYDEVNNEYTLTEPGRPDYTFENPSFSYGQFRSNFVLRWEYKLGSVLYLVWSHEQTNDEKVVSPRINESFDDLFQSSPGDVIMLKFSYWFSI